MQRISKLVRFSLLSIVSIAITTSCDKDNKNPVPDIPIYVEPIYIYDPEYVALLDVFGAYVVEGEGYLENGILIVNTGNNEYKAFDCTCTHEVKAGCWVRPNANQINTSTCSCCGSTYDLIYGSPTSGKATYMLKEYKVAFSNNTIRVYN